MFWFAKLQVVCLTMCDAWRTDGLFSSSRWHAEMKCYHSNFGLRYFIRNGCFNSYFTTHQLHCVSFHIGYDFTTNLVSCVAAVPCTSSSQTAILYKSTLGESSAPQIFTLVREGDSPKCSERSPGVTSCCPKSPLGQFLLPCTPHLVSPPVSPRLQMVTVDPGQGKVLRNLLWVEEYTCTKWLHRFIRGSVLSYEIKLAEFWVLKQAANILVNNDNHVGFSESQGRLRTDVLFATSQLLLWYITGEFLTGYLRGKCSKRKVSYQIWWAVAFCILSSLWVAWMWTKDKPCRWITAFMVRELPVDTRLVGTPLQVRISGTQRQEEWRYGSEDPLGLIPCLQCRIQAYSCFQGTYSYI